MSSFFSAIAAAISSGWWWICSILLDKHIRTEQAKRMKLTWHHWFIYVISTAALLWLRENWLFRPGQLMPAWIFGPLLIGGAGGAWGIARVDLRGVVQRIKWIRVVMWSVVLTAFAGIFFGSVMWWTHVQERKRAEAEALAIEMTAPFNWWEWPGSGGLRQLFLEAMSEGEGTFFAVVSRLEGAGAISHEAASELRAPANIVFKRDEELLFSWSPPPLKEASRFPNYKCLSELYQRLYWILESGHDWKDITSWAAADLAPDSEWDKHCYEKLTLALQASWSDETIPRIAGELKKQLIEQRSNRETLHAKWQTAWEKLSAKDRQIVRELVVRKAITLSHVQSMAEGKMAALDVSRAIRLESLYPQES